jgi:imidazolonepropionase-like amidohydrolase
MMTRAPQARSAPTGAVVVAVLFLATCPFAGIAAQPRNAPVAFVNVNVVPMDAERVLARQTVVVRDGRIAAIGPAADVEPPTGATRIDGTGKYLMPGLADMHVHAWSEEMLRVFIANGITTIRNMWGTPMHLDWRARISRGELIGPEIFTTGPVMDGSPPIWPTSTVVESAEAAAAQVREQKAAGYDFIKVYNRLKPDVYAAIIRTAREEGIRVVGHVPRAVGLAGVLKARQASVEHLDGFVYAVATATSPFDAANWAKLPAARRANLNVELEVGRALRNGSASFDDYFDAKKLAAIAAASRDAGTWHVPTLVVFWYMTPDQAAARLASPEMRFVEPEARSQWATASRRYAGHSADDMLSLETFNEAKRRRVKGLLDGGARILLGTDTPNPFVVPGLSIHQELRNFVQAGLTPYQAIRAGTHDAAEFLGALDSLGTVAVGRVADLVLVDANPLQDVANVARRSGVMLRGRWMPASELRQMLDDVAAAYARRAPLPLVEHAGG